MSKFAVILPAAGQSSRFSGFRRKKPFVELKGRPVWVRTAEHFANHPDVCQTILVVSPDDIEWFKEQFRANLAFMTLTLVEGGKTRAESVENGLKVVADQAEFVAVHDAARPLLTKQWIDSVFDAARKFGAAIPGLPISSTVKRLTPRNSISETVDRTSLVQAQTPQVFKKSLLLDAYSACKDLTATTDDASVVEQFGHAVFVVDGWPMNIKITTPEDFRLAELFVNALPTKGGLKNLHPFSDDLFG
ncbi:MAG: 2-C-methyl-D-erythritol 4-phosphate cytidylyltransferase [Planctomycetaceae bacterium]